MALGVAFIYIGFLVGVLNVGVYAWTDSKRRHPWASMFGVVMALVVVTCGVIRVVGA